MSAHIPWTDNLERQVRDWLFLLLRFAVTRDPNDRAAVMASAVALDSPGSARPSSFGFFVRTSTQVCDAILQNRDDTARQLLRKHAACIDDPRLRAAFLASLGLDETPQRQKPRRAMWRERDDLWRGLPKRPLLRRT